MFEHARRLRVLAAVGLVLALVEGRAWGQETIWTKAANVVRHICEFPCVLPPLPAHEERTGFESGPIEVGGNRIQQQPPPIFAWDKQDKANWDFAVGNCLEILGEYEWAYVRYKALSGRYRCKEGFATATERMTWKYWRKKEGLDESGFHGGMMVRTDLDDVIPWWTRDERQSIHIIDIMAPLLPDSECRRLLIDLGVIADPGETPSAGSDTGLGGYGIIF
ncbi:MAG TPA: hypothetical protein VKA46_33130 [Gemmataceae bacterium]|nr:hypothetical protein [Gemmataceae bacterium]